MAIASLDGYIASAKQKVEWTKTAGRTTVANGWYSMFDVAGAVGAGSISPGNNTAGVVPADTDAGYPQINTFGTGATGYLSRVEFANTVACRIALFDRVFHAGAFTFSAAATLSGQPSFASRLPNTDYKGLEIWVEQATVATGNQAVSVGYTNDAGATGKSTGAVGVGAAPAVGRCWQLPFQAGDQGVQKIDTVTGSVATVGTFNVMILRPLWTARVIVANWGDVHDMLKTGMPPFPAKPALFAMICADSTAAGVPEMGIEICNG